MTATVAAVTAALRHANANPAAAQRMISQPLSELARIGVRLHGGSDQEAARNLPKTAAYAHSNLHAASQGKMSASFVIDECVACQFIVGAVVAASFGAFVALGASSGGTVFIAMPEVVALAAALGVSPQIVGGAIAGIVAAGFTAGGGSLRQACKSCGFCR